MQEGEAEKQKAYVAKCRLPCPVTEDMLERLGAMKDVVLQQRTPTRVEQRRAMLVSAGQGTCTFVQMQYNADDTQSV